ncbi:transport protein Sec31 homolog B-like protein isoform X1 [Tanacetum coccineum]
MILENINNDVDSVRRRCSVLQWHPDFATQLIVASDGDSSLSLKDMRIGTLIARNIGASTHVCCEAALRNELEDWMLAL